MSLQEPVQSHRSAADEGGIIGAMFTSIDSIPAAGPHGERNLLRFSRAIFGEILQGVLVADQHRVIVAANDAFCTITC